MNLLTGTNPVGAAVNLLGGVRATIFAILGVALGATAVVQSYRLSQRTDQRDGLQAQVTTCAQANASNVDTISTLQHSNDAWAGLAADRQRKAADAVAAVARERDALAAELDAQRRARGELYRENADAAAWSRVAVPAGVADLLRK